MQRVSVCTLLFLWAVPVYAVADPLKDLVAASNAFLQSLDAGQRALTVLPFNSEERLQWHYVPKERAGLPLKHMSREQRELAMRVLSTALSAQGFEKVETIRSLEDVLKTMESTMVRDPELYYFTFFGEPSTEEGWALRYEGHHISLHWTILDGKIVATSPQFLGANPADVKDGPMQGTRTLAAEEDLGRQLVKSLSEEQRKAGVLSGEAPPDILSGAERVASIQEDLGVAYRDLNADQQGALIGLIQVYAHTQRPELAEERLAKVRNAGLDDIKFAWMGGIEKGQKHYYRVQGPTFLIEYDNTQNDANHIHTVWRDFTGDFGSDLLRQHYEEHAASERPGEHRH